ncbi:MAG: hypothetical protein ABI602_04380 [Candidatus Saccharibacteria bacterium]
MTKPTKHIYSKKTTPRPAKAAPHGPAASVVSSHLSPVKRRGRPSLPTRTRTRHPVRLPNVLLLTKVAALTLWRHKKLFSGIAVIYGLLNIVLVQGLASGTDVGNLKTELAQVFSGHFSSVASSLTIFVVLLGSAGKGSSNSAGAYQSILALLVSLVMIWALRQVLSGQQPRIRDAYYKSMTPLIPFGLVLLVIGLQLLPLLIGASLYATVTSNGIAVLLIEKLIWTLLFGVLAGWSLYMTSASIFALYIITLPDMTPFKALRSARELVRHRRWTVLRKMLFFPLVLLVITAVIMVPIIIFITPLVQVVFFGLTIFALLAVHSYGYTLYRELLNE